jgi:multiple sugar transport system ATP-binding protein
MAFLMDEPLGALDSELREVMCGELRGLHDRLKATTVYVTHDQTEAMSLGDKIAVMSNGVIEQMGAPREIYDRPSSVFVADFIGSPPMNLLTFNDSLEPGRGSVRVGQAEVGIPAPREAMAGRDLVLGVRPEHVRLNDGARLRGEVLGTEYLGTTQIVTVTTTNGVVKARLPSTLKASIGDSVGLEFRPDRISLFDAGSGRAIRTALYDHVQATEPAHV